MVIEHKNFTDYEIAILGGQIPQEDVPKIMEENPEFASYYRERRGLSLERQTLFNTI